MDSSSNKDEGSGKIKCLEFVDVVVQTCLYILRRIQKVFGLGNPKKRKKDKKKHIRCGI